MKYKTLFQNRKPIIGMIHTNSDSDISVLKCAKEEIDIYLKYGVCPLIENYYGTEEDCEEILEWMHTVHPNTIYGVNILGDECETFRLANEYGAKFVQIDSVCGHMSLDEEEAYVYELNEYRKNYSGVVLGGVRFKYYPVRSNRTLLGDLVHGMKRCDAIVCTGGGTGIETPIEKIINYKAIVGDFPVIVGAGVTQDTSKVALEQCDGMIVGSWFKYMHDAFNMVNEEYVRDFTREICL